MPSPADMPGAPRAPRSAPAADTTPKDVPVTDTMLLDEIVELRTLVEKLTARVEYLEAATPTGGRKVVDELAERILTLLQRTGLQLTASSIAANLKMPIEDGRRMYSKLITLEKHGFIKADRVKGRDAVFSIAPLDAGKE